MGKSFSSIGAALPPRRDLIAAADGTAAAITRGISTDSIIVPEARDRLLDLIEREQLPGEVKQTLAGSMTGDLHRQQLLFQAMIDTWPRLQKALREVTLKARKAPWEVVPHAERGEKADAAAEKLAKEVERAMWRMKPDMKTGKKGFEGTVQEIAMGYFLGHYVGEIHWERGVAKGLNWTPACTKTAPPRYYGYPNWEEGEDRLMLDPDGGQYGSQNYIDFPANRFLVAVNGGHPGHPTVAAPLRALAGFWMAAVFGLKWTMQYAQLFGIPFRWATYPTGDVASKNAVVAMLGTTGSQSWGAFPDGTNLNFVDSGKSAGGLVQADLIKIADEQCDIFILGQTLTSSQGDRGSQSLGEVHMEVRQELMAGVLDFVGEVLTHQLAPAIVALNYGDAREDVPAIWAKIEKPKDEKGMAERDNTLGLLDGKFPVGREWMYERHGIPMPAEGDELFKEEPEPVDPNAEMLKAETLKFPEGGKAERAGKPDKVSARYNPDQPRDPGGQDGGRWIKSPAAEGPTINFQGGGDIKAYLEQQRDEWRDGTIQSRGAGISEEEGEEEGDPPRWRVDLADGTTEWFDNETEAQSRWDDELAWFDSATITIKSETAYLTDDNGEEIIFVTKNDGVWIDLNGNPIESGSGEVDAETIQRATRLLKGMPVEEVDVMGTGGDFEFTGRTGGDEPYLIKGKVTGGTLEIGSMFPVDDKASFSGSSRGAGLLIQTVEAAEKARLEKITTSGAKGGNTNATGYRTWPALGFEASEAGKQVLADRLPAEMKSLSGDPPSLLQLTSTKEGRLWWRKNGDQVSLEFDLAEGSASRARLEQVKQMLAR